MGKRARLDALAAFGQAVRKERMARGFSQEALALAAEINRTYLGDVERGERNVALLNMLKIAGVLGIKLSSLIASMEGQTSSAHRCR
ncbi:MAG: helix-turn-helix domain-containing protein [Thermoanaerobaculia bacterium]